MTLVARKAKVGREGGIGGRRNLNLNFVLKKKILKRRTQLCKVGIKALRKKTKPLTTITNLLKSKKGVDSHTTQR